MDILMDIIKNGLSVIVTGIITFLITRYTCNRNIPLDKLEIAYNRIYYPMFQVIKKEKQTTDIVEKCELYLIKYNKYADITTIRTFQYLKDNQKSKKASTIFKSNVYSLNIRLRRKLGYLEPNIVVTYTYLSPLEKRMVRICIESLFCYLCVLICSLKIGDDIKLGVFAISILLLVVIIFEIIIATIQGIKKKITG